MTYLAGSTVSNVEANAILAELYEYNTDSKVTLAIPFNPEGFVRILDENKEVLHSDPVKSVRSTRTAHDSFS